MEAYEIIEYYDLLSNVKLELLELLAHKNGHEEKYFLIKGLLAARTKSRGYALYIKFYDMLSHKMKCGVWSGRGYISVTVFCKCQP